MPYVAPLQRDQLETRPPSTAGELNYAITRLCLSYLHGRPGSYADLNEVVGVLECAKQEFYRRMAVPYEDRKIEENGDVYP